LLHELGCTPAGRREREDRLVRVEHVHIGEVQMVLSAGNAAATQFVPPRQRDAFLAALNEGLRVGMPDVVLELPAVEIPPAQEDGGG
jgi:hypothetical protein